MARRPHRTRTTPPPAWLERQRAAVAFYARRHPGLNYNEIRQRADFKAAWRTAQQQRGKPSPSRAPAQVIGVVGAGLPRRPHRRVKGRARVGGFWQDRYQDAVEAYRRRVRLSTGEVLNYNQARQTAEFRLAWRTHRRMMESKDPDLSPDGEWARALVTLGLREDDWEWDVGDTPKHQKERRA